MRRDFSEFSVTYGYINVSEVNRLTFEAVILTKIRGEWIKLSLQFLTLKAYALLDFPLEEQARQFPAASLDLLKQGCHNEVPELMSLWQFDRL